MSQQTHLHAVDRARFEAGSETVDNGNTPPTGGGNDRTKRLSKTRSDKAIPTDRLSFDKQIKVLLAVAATSGNARRGSTAEAMSAAIDLSGGTGGLNSRFFRAAGWFEAVGRGEYTASDGLLAYNQHIAIDPDAQFEASAKMRNEAKRSWFWETLEPMLASGHPINLKLAVLELAKAAGATDHKVQLETVIDWLVWVGLVERHDDQIKLLATSEPTKAEDQDDPDPLITEDKIDETPAVDPMATPAKPQASDLDAIVSFNMSVRLTAADMKSLDQEQRDFVLALAEKLRG